MTYYLVSGRENVDKTLALSKTVAEELGIESVVIASTTGFTAKKAAEVFNGTGVELTFVGTSKGRFSSELMSELKLKGHNICFSNEVKYEYHKSLPQHHVPNPNETTPKSADFHFSI